jgi:predicted CoA-substrate-specific enzyme activase
MMAQHEATYLLGIDVGSTTAKIAVVDANRKLVFSEYRRHKAEQSECVRQLLLLAQSHFPNTRFKVAMCGSGARPIAEHLDVDFVQEVVANSIAVKFLHPEARTAIELGGQDAKIIFFYFDEASKQLVASDMRMNGVCAGGTGAFIDEIAQLLLIPVEEFNACAERGSQTYQVSGRCGVFAKTDIQPLLNQGADKADLALSTLHAVARQTIGGLAQGTTLKAPIVFEGGPLTFNPKLIQAFAEHLGLEPDQIIIPDQPEVIVAHGCALSTEILVSEREPFHYASDLARRLGTKKMRNTDEAVSSAQVFFDSDRARTDFFERHQVRAHKADIPDGQDRLDVYLGIDAGSTTSKFVFLDKDENLVHSHYSNNEGAPLEVLRSALIEARDKARRRGMRLNILGAGTTGYGEELTAAAFHADYHTVETVAHARAALKYQPNASFVLDIGGQDMKAIFVNDRTITGITLNEACSSGCGAFIETFAQSLGVPVEKIAERAFESTAPAQLGSRCTVFMRSKVITEIKNGKSPSDILAGLCQSIIQNVFTKVIRLHNLEALGDHIVVQGGTFKNDAILRAMELHTQKEITRAPYAELMGAIGIALLTKEQCGAQQESSFLGLDNLETLDYQEESGRRCPFCANHCNRSVVHFADGTHYVQGNRCERGEIIGDLSDESVRQQVQCATQRILSVPNLVEERERLILKNYEVSPVCPPRDITIGIPRALDAWTRLPFWRGLFRALGFDVKVSGKSSHEVFESGLATIPSDTVCFPAKLAHGHYLSLIDQKVDRIFTPNVMNGLSQFPQLEEDYPCAVLHGYGLVLKTNIPTDILQDTPAFLWKSAVMREKQLIRYFGKTFGIESHLVKAAIREADSCQSAFQSALENRAKKVIAQVEAADGFAVVLCMRPYQNDPLINHHLGKYFVRLGVPVIPADALPDLSKEDLSSVQVRINSNIQATFYAAARVVARHPHLELAQITSFGCGHDAVVSDELQRLVQREGKQMLLLKLDESDVRGPLRIRILSFVDTVRQRRDKPSKVEASSHMSPAMFTAKDKRERTLFIPNLSVGFSTMLGAVVEGRGFNFRVLPLADDRAIELGKLYLHNDICFPAQINVGEFLRVMESEDLDPGKIALGMHQNCKTCRAGQYAMISRIALDAAGYAEIPIVTTGNELGNVHPGFKVDARMQRRILYGLVVLDALEDLRRSTRPYELRAGDAEAEYTAALEGLCRTLPHNLSGVWETLESAVVAFNRIPLKKGPRKPLVMVLGEILLAVHPSANYNLERYLEKHGMEVLGTRLSDFFHCGFIRGREEKSQYFEDKSLLLSLVNKLGDRMFERTRMAAEKIMAGYSRYRPRVSAHELYEGVKPHIDRIHLDGEGWLIPGEIMHAASQGLHSFVVVQPFGCMPNHIFGRGVIRLAKDVYPHIQIQSLDFDPDTSMGNIENRLQMLIMNARELEKLRLRSGADLEALRTS